MKRMTSIWLQTSIKITLQTVPMSLKKIELSNAKRHILRKLTLNASD